MILRYLNLSPGIMGFSGWQGKRVLGEGNRLSHVARIVLYNSLVLCLSICIWSDQMICDATHIIPITNMWASPAKGHQQKHNSPDNQSNHNPRFSEQLSKYISRPELLQYRGKAGNELLTGKEGKEFGSEPPEQRHVNEFSPIPNKMRRSLSQAESIQFHPSNSSEKKEESLRELESPVEMRESGGRQDFWEENGEEDEDGDAKDERNRTLSPHEYKRLYQETNFFYKTVLLAQQEAKCLQDFGGQQQISDFPLDDDLFPPFLCPNNTSPLHRPCEQCRNLTRRLPHQDGECKSKCEGAQWNCLERCLTIFRHVQDHLGRFKVCKRLELNSTLGKNGNFGYCTSSHNFGPLLYLLSPSRPTEDEDKSRKETKWEDKGGGSSVSWFWDTTTSSPEAEGGVGRLSRKRMNHIESVQVFCEGVDPPQSSYDPSSPQRQSQPKEKEGGKRLRSEGRIRHVVLLKTRFYTRLRKVLGHNETRSNQSRIPGTAQDRAREARKTSAVDPIVFVVEQREVVGSTNGSRILWSSWQPLGKSPFGFDEIPVKYHQQSYQWRVTALNSHRILDRVSTQTFTTLDGYVEPGPPQRVYVKSTRVVGNSLNVLIAWQPPKERACFYKIVLDSQESEEKPMAVRIRGEPLGVHRYWFENVSFGKQYAVRITSRSAGWDEDESTQTKLHFITPTCLQMYAFNFTRCKPPPPRNLTSELSIQAHSSSSSSSLPSSTVTRHLSPGKRSPAFVLKLAWAVPEHASDTNLIQHYVVHLSGRKSGRNGTGSAFAVPAHQPTSFASFASASSSSHPPLSTSKPSSTSSKTVTPGPPPSLLGPFLIPGNVTQLEIGNLEPGMEYQVRVSAVSEKGASFPAKLTVITGLGKDLSSEDDDFQKSVAYVVGPVVASLTLVLFYTLTRFCLYRRKVRAARNFEATEEQDGMPEGSWSFTSRPRDEAYSPWKLLDENLPKDKWDIGIRNLSMGEVIGRGAFGVVRRAQIPRSKFLELQSKCDSPAASEVLTTDLDEPEKSETVAVKMLKVAASKADREALVREIITMQNLGCHPRIVTLLGACTKGPHLCLVMEYCPGGDLLTHLRQIREDYWPLLNLGGNRAGFVASAKEEFKHLHNPAFSLNFSRAVAFPQLVNEINVQRESRSDGALLLPATRGYSTNGPSYPRRTSFCGEKINSDNSPFFAEWRNPVERIPAPEPHDTNNQKGKCFGCGTSSGYKPENKDLPINEKDILSYARQIALGMAYLEQNHVVHRDLACRNILLMADKKQIKISDFGLSRDIYSWNVYHQKSDAKLPIKWMAIESIFSHIFTSKSDVWAYGVVLHELVTLGGNPYPAIGNSELFNLLRNGYRQEQPENCSFELYILMRKCWRTNPCDRPCFNELWMEMQRMLESSQPYLYLILQRQPYSHLCHSSTESKVHQSSPTNTEEATCICPSTSPPPSCSNYVRRNNYAVRECVRCHINESVVRKCSEV